MSATNTLIGISIGDANGIGAEIILKTFRDTKILKDCTPIIFANPIWLDAYGKAIGVKITHINIIKSIKEVKRESINLFECFNNIPLHLGQENLQGAMAAWLSLKTACDCLKKKQIDALVTAPIAKGNMKQTPFGYPGHTEYLSNVDGNLPALMLMVSKDMKLATVTGHIPFSKVSSFINKDIIIEKIKTLIFSLKHDFKIHNPKIAVLSLNPHAGENGLLGHQETQMLIPAIQDLEKEYKYISGPYSADTFFSNNFYLNFDGIMAMYHDQGLIPFKLLYFDTGINFTAGLSFIRTSPDHGTAFNIAGKNKANPDSFKHAVLQALHIHQNRSTSSTWCKKGGMDKKTA